LNCAETAEELKQFFGLVYDMLEGSLRPANTLSPVVLQPEHDAITAEDSR